MNSAGAIWGQSSPGEITPDDQIDILLINKYKNNYYSAYTDFIDQLYIGDAGALLKNCYGTTCFT